MDNITNNILNMVFWDIISFVCVMSGIASALFIGLNVYRKPQKMRIMNSVWVLTGLWGGLIALREYLRFGMSDKPSGETDMEDMGEMEGMADMNMGEMHEQHHELINMEPNISEDMNMVAGMEVHPRHEMKMKMPMEMHSDRPFWQKITLSALHCGAGCTLADIIGESLGYAWLRDMAGWTIYWQWGFDYILALIIGVLFQFAAIHPMTNMSVGQTLLRAFRIDFLSLTSWQLGMFLTTYFLFFIFPAQIYHANTVVFWFIMQIAMGVGFLFAYPTNYFLVKKGIKPAM